MTGDIYIFFFFFLEMGSLMTSSSSAGPIRFQNFQSPAQCSIKTNNDLVCRTLAELAIFQLRFFFVLFFSAFLRHDGARTYFFLRQNMKTCAIGAMAQPGLNTAIAHPEHSSNELKISVHLG